MRWGQNTEQKIQQSAGKNLELQQDEHFQASAFQIMTWDYYK